jgi:hypothetical protein
MSNKIIESKLENQNNLQMATFAAGCFWGVEDAFSQINILENGLKIQHAKMYAQVRLVMLKQYNYILIQMKFHMKNLTHSGSFIILPV